MRKTFCFSEKRRKRMGRKSSLLACLLALLASSAAAAVAFAFSASSFWSVAKGAFFSLASYYFILRFARITILCSLSLPPRAHANEYEYVRVIERKKKERSGLAQLWRVLYHFTSRLRYQTNPFLSFFLSSRKYS